MQGLTGRLWEIWWDTFVLQFDGREICQVVFHKSEVFYWRVSKPSNPVLKLWVSHNLVYCLFALLPLTLAVLVEGSTLSPPPPFPLLSKNWWLRYAGLREKEIALTVWDRQCLEDFELKDESINQWWRCLLVVLGNMFILQDPPTLYKNN